MERPKFRRPKEPRLSSPHFEINNLWNISNPNIRVEIDPVAIASLAKRFLLYTDDDISNTQIVLLDGGFDQLPSSNTTRRKSPTQVILPLDRVLVSGLDSITHFQQHKEQVENYMKRLTGNDAFEIDGLDPRFSDPTYGQKLTVAANLVAGLYKAKLRKEIERHTALTRKQTAVSNLLASINGSMAIWFATSNSKFGLPISMFFGYELLRGLDVKKTSLENGTVRKQQILESENNLLELFDESFNEEALRDWVDAVSIERQNS